MGRFLKWIARKGAVGGTARWAAQMYRLLREEYPRFKTESPAVTYRMMIARRFQVLPNAAQKEYLGQQAYTVQGLMGLVIEILKVEAGLAENEPEPMIDMLEVIAEELKKGRLSHEEIFGQCRAPSDYLRSALSRPTL